nr:MAG TPA: hypothetical protein [Caudoviricetes sp.]
MAKRIEKLQESPCYNCGYTKKCSKRIKNNYRLGVIRDSIFGNSEYDYSQCPIRIAFVAPEMVEIEEVGNGK